MQKLRALLPGQQTANNSTTTSAQHHAMVLEPEIGFQISIKTTQVNNASSNQTNGIDQQQQQQQQQQHQQQQYQQNQTRTAVPELNVNLIAARHLPGLFGFKIVQGYLIKVKLFPGSKRLDSSIQTNTWPKFNENFKFPLAPDLKPTLKHFAPRRNSNRPISGDYYTPDELLSGQFVVFTVYALLELPPASFNRFNKTYRSLRDKSTNLVQKVIESSSGIANGTSNGQVENQINGNENAQNGKGNSKRIENPRDPVPPLTISESRRNIGSVTCYLEPKLFKRNPRSGLYTTEELWLPIKDITTTVTKAPTGSSSSSSGTNNNLINSAKGVVELMLELRDLNDNYPPLTPANTPAVDTLCSGTPPDFNLATTSASSAKLSKSEVKWQRMSSQVKRKMGISNINHNNNNKNSNLILRVTTTRMRCSNKAKDELETTAGSGIYVKTAVFEHGIYINAWKSPTFFPSLSTKWNTGGDAAMLEIPLKRLEQLDNILIRTTLATKTKMGKKLVLGTVIIGMNAPTDSGAEHLQQLREAPSGESIVMWHSYQ